MRFFPEVSRKNMFCLFFLLVFGAFMALTWMLFDTHILKNTDGAYMSGESTYGDLPFHLTTISQIAKGGIFPPENPFYGGKILVYPYAINLISALLVTSGVSMRASIIFPGMIFSALMFLALYFFNKSLLKSKKGGLLATILFFGYGGLGFVYFVRDTLFAGKLGEFAADPRTFPDYSHLFDENIQWNNFWTRILVPERSVLLGIPLGVLIIYLLFLRKGKRTLLGAALAGALMGFMPLLHTHTFIVFALIIPLLAIFEYQADIKKRFIKKWLVFGTFSSLFFLPISAWMAQNLSAGKFLTLHLGWMAEPGVLAFLAFWIKNGGVILPLMLSVYFFKNTPTILKRLVFVSLVIVVIVNIFQFQPYDWDNVKLLFWVTVFGSSASAFVIARLFDANILGKFFGACIFLGLTLSLPLSMYRELRVRNTLFSKEAVALGVWAEKNTPKGSLFLTAPIHNSFASNLAGRRIFMGYPGLLWVHGIDYRQRLAELDAVYEGGENAAQIISSRGIDYVVVGPYERGREEPVDESFFSENYELVESLGEYNIYKTH